MSDVDDMVHDIEAKRIAQAGIITDRKRACIEQMHFEYGFDAEWIAEQLSIDVEQVESEMLVIIRS